MTVTLWIDDAPASVTACWILARKAVPFRERLVAGEDVELDRLAPGSGPPVLVDGETVVAGATPIAHYLERAHPEPSVFPPDSQKRNQAATMNEFAESALGGVLARFADGSTDPERLIAGFHRCFDHIRFAIKKGALDSDFVHLGDVAMAAHLAACRSLAETNLDRDYPDLVDYFQRVQRACEKGDR